MWFYGKMPFGWLLILKPIPKLMTGVNGGKQREVKPMAVLHGAFKLQSSF